MDGEQALSPTPIFREPLLEERIRARFGVVPNFYRLSSETPAIPSEVWGFAQAAYLDNPLPSLFKERLLVYVSRFCEARYYVARHVGYLVGLGRPSGDRHAPIQPVADVVQLLKRPFLRGEELRSLLALYSKAATPLDELPPAGSDTEEALFAFAAHVFLQTPEAPACLHILNTLLGDSRLHYLKLFLLFVRAAHYWIRLHPDITFEEDIKQLLATYQDLAECVLNDREATVVARRYRTPDELHLLLDQSPPASDVLSAIVDSSNDAIVSKTLDGIITSWNKGAEHLFGYSDYEAIGEHITLIIPQNRWDEEQEILRQIKQGKRIGAFETIRVRKDGRLVDVSVAISPVKDAAGIIVGASNVTRDITARKQGEKVLAGHARRQKALFDLTDQVQRSQSLEDIYTAGLDAICAALECDRASVLLFDESHVMRFVAWRGLSDDYRQATDGHSPWKFGDRTPAPICIDDVESGQLGKSLTAVVRSEGIAAVAFFPLASEGMLIGKFMAYFQAPHAFTDDEISLALTIARQLAFGISRKRADAELTKSEERYRKLSESPESEVETRTKEMAEQSAELLQQSEQLREISRRMMRVESDERRRIARELHDGAGQNLAALAISLAALVKQVRPALAGEARQALELVQELNREIRTTAYLLHPPLLDENGLSDALGWYVRGISDRSGLKIRLSIPPDFERLPHDLELAIFRLVQESLTNVHRHSGSDSAEISTARKAQTICLDVRDRGTGIPAEKLAEIQSGKSTSVGLRGMRERVQQFKGEFRLQSDSSGTSIPPFFLYLRRWMPRPPVRRPRSLAIWPTHVRFSPVVSFVGLVLSLQLGLLPC